MRREGLVAGVVFAVVVALFIAIGLVAWRSLANLPAREDIATASARAARAVVEEAVVDSSATEPEPERRVRFVEEDGVVSMVPDGPLLRVPSVAPEPEPSPPQGPDPDIYRLVIIEGAGLINARDRLLRLAHVDAPPADRICQREDGERWPCGRRARTALRRLVRRRAIACLDLDPDAPPPEDNAPIPVRCEVAGTDLARWLVAQGWAAPADGAPEEWTALHEAAQEEQRGLYAPDPL
jgi:endonuclease YncB( thermonuclease family)